MKSFVSRFGALVLMLLSAVAAGDEWLSDLRELPPPAPVYRFERSAQRHEVVVPELVNPDLNGTDSGWQNAWQAPEFTVPYKDALAMAHALQGGGEWQSLLGKTLKVRQPTQVLLGWDKQYFYLKIRCFQKQMPRLLAAPSVFGHDGAVYNHENVDLIFCANRNRNEYYQIITDVAGNTYDACQTRNGKADLSWDPKFYKNISHDSQSWTLTLALPLSAWGIPLKTGGSVDLNIGRLELFDHELSSMQAVNRTFAEADRMLRVWLGARRELPGLQMLEQTAPQTGVNHLAVVVDNPSASGFDGMLKCLDHCDKLKLAAHSRRQVDLPWVATAGAHTLNVVLTDGTGEIVDSATLALTVPPPVSVNLSASEIVSGAPVNGEVQVHPLRTGDMLEFSYGERRMTVPARARLAFKLNLSGQENGTYFQVTLQRAGQPSFQVKQKLTVIRDPFAE